jgi:Cu/Ag efflux protein CusF
MAKKLTMLVSLLLVVAVMTVPAFALNVPGFKHHETGRISAIDKDAHTFTVTGDKDGKKFTFEMKDRAKLANLRTGEHVRVAYKKEGARFVATDVAERAEKTAARR